MAHSKEMKKVAILLGDFFWSSIPYDGISLLKILKEELEDQVDLLMFEKDIRLNKKFQGNEKYYFNTDVFTKEKNLRTIKNWGDLYNISKDYSIVVTSTHIAPKTRYPKEIRNMMHCPMAAWDVGGADILTNATMFATIYFAKAPIWKQWLQNKGIDEKKIYVTGSPHYDPYITGVYDLECKKSFFAKYDLKMDSKSILVCPSNPGSHKEQFQQNMLQLKLLSEHCNNNNVNLLIKTYPHDYIFHELESQFTGIYKRIYSHKPQYQILKEVIPNATIIESQDHYLAMMFSDAMFNMSGSHVAWETHFSKIKSYSMNYRDKLYYSKVSYLKDVIFPDELYDTHIEKITDIKVDEKIHHVDNQFFISTNSCKSIKNHIKNLIL